MRVKVDIFPGPGLTGVYFLASFSRRAAVRGNGFGCTAIGPKEKVLMVKAIRHAYFRDEDSED